jgi:hypothetical protein
MARRPNQVKLEQTTDEPGTKLRLLTFGDLDNRTASAQLVRSLVAAFVNDVGGPECVTEGIRQLIQRAAILGALIEDTEARWLRGDKLDKEWLGHYLAAVNAQRRVLETIGLERRARPVDSLVSYINRQSKVVDEVLEAS